ncbi:MAG: hypothetical protein ABSE07_05735 [Methanoregula sp.]|jgi:bifunctional DNA-binding transcriptional regulator/antitoxin component of YhaV-PrlF toxin-antitoxin module
MIQKKVQNQDGIKKGTKKIFLKAMKEKFSEDPNAMSTIFERKGLEQSPRKIEFLKAGKKAEMERGIEAYEPMRSHIRNNSHQDQSRELVIIDHSGRLVLPKKIRNLFDSNRFEVRATENHIELIPIKPLHTLFGILPEINMEKIYREHDVEVEEEDAD